MTCKSGMTIPCRVWHVIDLNEFHSLILWDRWLLEEITSQMTLRWKLCLSTRELGTLLCDLVYLILCHPKLGLWLGALLCDLVHYHTWLGRDTLLCDLVCLSLTYTLILASTEIWQLVKMWNCRVYHLAQMCRIVVEKLVYYAHVFSKSFCNNVFYNSSHLVYIKISTLFWITLSTSTLYWPPSLPGSEAQSRGPENQ